MNPFIVSTVIGLALVCAYFVGCLLNLLVHIWFKWIGDGEEAFRRDWYIRFVMIKILNFKEESGYWKYRNKNGEGSDGDIAAGLTLLVCLFLPVITYVCYLQPIVLVTLVTFIAVSFALRGVKRLIKELKAHKQDKDAHK